MYRLFIIIFALIVLPSCSSIGVKKANVSTLQNHKIQDGNKRHSLMFVKVDGKGLSNLNPFTAPNKSSHYVEPGQRKLDLKVTLTSDKTEVVWAAQFKVSALLEQNEIYRIKASEDNWCIKLELVNSQGKVISGPFYSKLGPFLSYNHMKNKGLMAKVRRKIKNASCT